MRPALVILIAYLLGSIPFGYLIVRATAGDDIRETGSGGTGATNVSRRAGKVAGVVTLLLDALKGAVAVVIGGWIVSVPILTSRPEGIPGFWWLAAAGVAVIVGHMFPVWLGFRGGKGVATGVGVFLILAPLALGLTGILFVLIVMTTRFVSLGSIISAAALPLLVLIQNAFITPVVQLIPVVTASAISAGLIVYAHRGNIDRIMKGTENKFK